MIIPHRYVVIDTKDDIAVASLSEDAFDALTTYREISAPLAMFLAVIDDLPRNPEKGFDS